ncbi:MAG: Crp/Fnr family transcriptional regulator [Candidatus Delongbacteria bacterium]|nr:Crp/Fnr family transcriptional regulator [Candidatus Delongbacteria bacterium]MBN2837000.1 Crp/Fnr family transcriptional regulator [Candidatus Delongbacteria bacterium]
MEIADKVDNIVNLPLFFGLKDTDVKRIADQFIISDVKKNKFLFEEGVGSHWIFFVLRGKIKVLAHSASGKDVIVKLSTDNDLLTDNGVIYNSDSEYNYSAQALEDSIVAKVSVTDFKNMLNTFPVISLNLNSLLDKYLRDSYLVLRDMALEKVERRIAINILKLAKRTGVKVKEGIKLQIKLSRQDIANLSGTTIETAIRVMSKLKKDGIISEEKGSITITQRHRLVSIAEEF